MKNIAAFALICILMGSELVLANFEERSTVVLLLDPHLDRIHLKEVSDNYNGMLVLNLNSNLAQITVENNKLEQLLTNLKTILGDSILIERVNSDEIQFGTQDDIRY